MPLIESKSPESMSKNIEKLRHEGYPEKKSVAISYSEKRKAIEKEYHNGHIDISNHPIMKKNHVKYK